MSRHTLRRRYGRAVACPSGSEVQSLLFDRRFFTIARAREWAKDHNRKYGDVDVKPDFIHLRQQDPALFRRMRTISLGHGGVGGVVGWKKC